ncbi:MAG: Uma2 family endonuclease [bacterium]|nr:Uma2 family endonuclease [bacterium]
MPLPLESHFITHEEYLAIEREADHKSEYFNGEIFAMSGASRRHNLMVVNVLAGLHRQLRKRPCEVYASDMRVKVSATGLYTYPDVIVVCEPPQLEDKWKDTLLNPTVVIEVLSKSTESYDRGAKFEHYRAIKSLSDYILIAQDKYHVECYVRQPDNSWLFSEAKELHETIHIASVECEFALEDVYEKVEMVGE